MATIESQSPELVSHLRKSLVSAILGDVDTSLNALAGTDLIPCGRRLAAPALDRRPVPAQPRQGGKRSVLSPAST
jgi:hypothetical protein